VDGFYLQQVRRVDESLAFEVACRVLQNSQRGVDSCYNSERLASREKLHLDADVADGFRRLGI
jgi:hypothetical protein